MLYRTFCCAMATMGFIKHPLAAFAQLPPAKPHVLRVRVADDFKTEPHQ